MTRTHRMRAVLCVLLAALPFLAFAQEKKTPTDKELLQGTWKAVSVEVNGQFEKESVGRTLTLKGDKLIVQDLERVRLLVKLQPDKKPKEFDLLDREEKVILKGIYKLEGDTLIACYPERADAVEQRPKEFSGAEGSKQVVLTAKKVKVKNK